MFLKNHWHQCFWRCSPKRKSSCLRCIPNDVNRPPLTGSEGKQDEDLNPNYGILYFGKSRKQNCRASVLEMKFKKKILRGLCFSSYSGNGLFRMKLSGKGIRGANSLDSLDTVTNSIQQVKIPSFMIMLMITIILIMPSYESEECEYQARANSIQRVEEARVRQVLVELCYFDFYVYLPYFKCQKAKNIVWC